MNKKNKRIILSAVGAVVGAFAIYSSAASSQKPVKTITAYELKNNVQVDGKITVQDMQKVAVKETDVKDWMVRDPNDAIGKHAKVDLYAGETIRKDRLSDKEVLKFSPDERTMNIDVTLSKTAGLPKPGDRVDILAAVPQGDPNNPTFLSKLVLQNVYVTRVITRDGLDTTQPSADVKDTRTLVPAYVTVNVSVPQAEVINSLAANTKVQIRLLGRTFNSQNVN